MTNKDVEYKNLTIACKIAKRNNKFSFTINGKFYYTGFAISLLNQIKNEVLKYKEDGKGNI